MTKLLLNAYRSAQRCGLLSHPWFKPVFRESYFFYKRHLEDPFQEFCFRYPQALKGGNILDVGANIGYTASVFGRFVSDGYRVYAFEPGRDNFALLEETIRARRLTARVIPVNYAVGDQCRLSTLWINEGHHADHRIVTAEFDRRLLDSAPQEEIEMTTVDAFIAAQAIPFPVSFIKIDVQGYELPVFQGMSNTIAENPDLTIAFEYAPASIQALGFEPEPLISFLAERQFRFYELRRKSPLKEVDGKQIAAKVPPTSYIDLIATRKSVF